MTKEELLGNAIYWFKAITEDLARVTTGNPSSNIASIKGKAIRAYEFLEKHSSDSPWKPADGVDLPEYDREVVVFTHDLTNVSILRVSIALRPDPREWERDASCIQETYDNGWNIPGVKYWLDIDLPKNYKRKQRC
jgi:hypothetical protein